MAYGKLKNVLPFLPILLLFNLLSCETSPSSVGIIIEDEEFLEALIDLGVDANGDGEITSIEAESIHKLELGPKHIHSLSGLEAFINLDTLQIYMNPLIQLDLRANVKLTYLECTGCELTELDVSNNHLLKHLDCSGGAALSNALTSLDLSNNTALVSLNCELNQITDLDLSYKPNLSSLICGRNKLSQLEISGNVNLTRLVCNNNLLRNLNVSLNTNLTKVITCGNQLSHLDLSQNTTLINIGIDNMPSLTEVCVWTLPFPPSGISILMGYSPNVVFSIDCSQ